MARTRNKLTVNKIKTLEPGMHGDGGGLWLRVMPTGSKQWVYRFRFHGRQRQMGLGGLEKISLAKARRRRDEVEALVVDGIDPVQAKRQERARGLSSSVSLASVAESAFEARKARKAQLKDNGKAGRWFSPLALHVLPKLGNCAIVSLTQSDIKQTLEPIWHSKASTAQKAINRLNIVIQHAVAMGLDVDMQVVPKAKVLLGQQRHVVKHIESMPWQEVPRFYASLTRVSPVQLALRLSILNPGSRSKPLRFLRLEQIDGNVWTIPEGDMKGKEGRVPAWRTPLGDESLKVIELAKPFEVNGYLFPNQSRGNVISDASMSRLMERRGLPYRPHGFRSSFRTWVAEMKKPRDIGELCLAHKIYGKVEASYLRSDQLEQRAELLQSWSRFVLSAR